jgi:hypothetical protein
MPAWSSILNNVARGARATRGARFAGRAARRAASPHMYREGRALRAFNKVGNLTGSKAFMIPFGVGAFGLGAVEGFGKEIMNDPLSKAWATGVMNTSINPQIQQSGEQWPWGAPKYESVFKNTYPNNFGRPLGYYSKAKNYNTVYGPQWQPSTNDPLGASGELMLATFATRHGR